SVRAELVHDWSWGHLEVDRVRIEPELCRRVPDLLQAGLEVVYVAVVHGCSSGSDGRPRKERAQSRIDFFFAGDPHAHKALLLNRSEGAHQRAARGGSALANLAIAKRFGYAENAVYQPAAAVML